MSYERINWEDAPSTKTPINAENLNKMDAAIKKHDTLLNSGTTAGNNLAEVYDATATYAAGSYCVNENVLYKAAVDITAPEEWNAEHWQKTTVMAEIAELKASLGTQVIFALDGAALAMTTK